MFNELLRGISFKAPFESFPLHVSGYVLFGMGLLMAVCFAVMGCPDGTSVKIGLGAGIMICAGLGLLVTFRSPEKVLPLKGIITVSIVLFLASLCGAVPYLAYDLPFMSAFFESMSGLTTTGITALDDLSAIPRSILLWRSLTGWVGGIGFICIFTLFMSSFGLGGRYLFSSDLLSYSRIFTNRMKSLALRFLVLYIAITVVQSVLLTVVGTPFFDSLCLSMSTVSTTGFAVADNEIVSLSMASKAVIAVFMVIAATNFITAYTAIVKRSIQPFKEDKELKYLFIWLITVVIALTVILYRSGFEFDSFDSFFDVLFYALSVATTTGFVAEYMNWADTAVLFLSVVALIGGCSNSASGGLKIDRLRMIVRMTLSVVRNATSPNRVYSINDSGAEEERDVVYSSIIIAVMFLIIAAIGAGAISILTNQFNFSDSIALSIASLSTVGSGLFELTAIELGPWVELVLCILMWIGRLEVILAVIILTPGFWNSWILSRRRKITNP